MSVVRMWRSGFTQGGTGGRKCQGCYIVSEKEEADRGGCREKVDVDGAARKGRFFSLGRHSLHLTPLGCWLVSVFSGLNNSLAPQCWCILKTFTSKASEHIAIQPSMKYVLILIDHLMPRIKRVHPVLRESLVNLNQSDLSDDQKISSWEWGWRGEVGVGRGDFDMSRNLICQDILTYVPYE